MQIVIVGIPIVLEQKMHASWLTSSTFSFPDISSPIERPYPKGDRALSYLTCCFNIHLNVWSSESAISSPLMADLHHLKDK
jgi:hypothetical protein